MPATLRKTTTFTGSTSVGAAGTTTGAGSNWSDPIGNIWNKTSGTLRKQLGSVYNDFLIDLDNTAILNQQIEWEAIGYNSGTGGLRIITAGVNSQGYFLAFDGSGNGPVVIAKEHSTNGPTTIATSAGNFNQNQSGHTFLYRLKAEGTGPTTVSAKGYDLTAAATVTISQSGGTATVLHTSHGYTTGDLPNIYGAAQAGYNGEQSIIVVNANTYTYSVPVGTASPATGTIVAATALFSVSGTDNTAELQTSGYFGFSGLGEGSGYGVRIVTARLYDLADIADLTIADPTLAAKSPTKIGAINGRAAGGNETYGYQWYIHTTNNFGAATAVSGATGRRGYVFRGLTASTTYYIWCKVTDTQVVPDTATSNVLTVTTNAGSETDDVFGDIGDSNMTTNVMDAADAYIDAHNSTGVLHFAGSEGSSTHSGDWVPLTTRLTDTIDAFIADLVDVVVSVLGTNDATLPVAPATYGSNTAAMTAELVAHGFRSIVCAPPTNGDGSNSSIQTHLIDYQAQLAALDNGTTILYGGSLLFDRSLADPNTWMDIAGANGIHYSTAGRPLAGDAIGEMVVSVLSAPTPPVLTSAVASSTGQTVGTVGATTNKGNGTLYAIVTTDITAPTAGQVESGQTSTGATATFSGSVAVSSTGPKTISVTGLAAATTYRAYLMHKDVAGNRSSVVTPSAFTTSAAPVLPSAPTRLLAVPGNSQISLSWTSASGATSYSVYRGTSTGGELLVHSGITGTAFVDTTLTNHTTYFYRVTGVNSEGESAQSAEVSAMPMLPSVSGLTSTITNISVKLDWVTVPGATKYNVYRDGVFVASPTTNTYTDTQSSGPSIPNYTVTWFSNSNVESSTNVISIAGRGRRGSSGWRTTGW